MIVSHKHKVIFIHIQKAAGSSVFKALLKTDDKALLDKPPLKFPVAVKKSLIKGAVKLTGNEESWYGRAPICEGRHIRAFELQDCMQDEIFSDYFKFAVVRNPYSRLVSWYHMITQRGGAAVKLWRYVSDNSNSFESFIKNCTEEIYESPFERKSFMYNQIDYVTDKDGEIIVDYIARQETLDADLKKIVALTGMPPFELGNINPSKHDHYSTYYNDETIEIVTKRFQRDLDAFGYKFERKAEPALTR